MPTYDYKCSSCGHTFEKFQSITARPLRKCPSCGRQTVKRLIGMGGGVIFKGSGFYQTDYRSESYKKAAKAESEGSGGKDHKGTKKSDAGKSDATSTGTTSTDSSKKKAV